MCIPSYQQIYESTQQPKLASEPWRRVYTFLVPFAIGTPPGCPTLNTGTGEERKEGEAGGGEIRGQIGWGQGPGRESWLRTSWPLSMNTPTPVTSLLARSDQSLHSTLISPVLSLAS